MQTSHIIIIIFKEITDSVLASTTYMYVISHIYKLTLEELSLSALCVSLYSSISATNDGGSLSIPQLLDIEELSLSALYVSLYFSISSTKDGGSRSIPQLLDESPKSPHCEVRAQLWLKRLPQSQSSTELSDGSYTGDELKKDNFTCTCWNVCVFTTVHKFQKLYPNCNKICIFLSLKRL